MRGHHGVRWDAPVARATRSSRTGVRWDAPRVAVAGVRWDAPRYAAMGVRWDAPAPRLAVAAIVAAAMLAMLLGPAVAVAARTPVGASVDVIVRTAPGAVDTVEQLVRSMGGTVVHRLHALETVTARVPAAKVPAVEMSPQVRSVAPDTRVRLLSTSGGAGSRQLGTPHNVSQTIGSDRAWQQGLTGKGVGVALIDTGVVPVRGLNGASVVAGADLSPEGQFPQVRGLDTYGHGTHMAGLIAGGKGRHARRGLAAKGKFVGTAPDATLLSVKVAGSDGATDVSQVLAAIDWVVQHRNDRGMNIRVLNLSFGTDGAQDYRIDPLTYAAEVAWRKGIVVVAAAGNSGFTSGRLANPAYDPHIIAVGASDHQGTAATRDDTVADFSSKGDGARNVDLVAPGRSIQSLRNAGSRIDEANPQGRVGRHIFKGTGTSQAAAIVSGAAALLLQQRPHLTPDQVKRILTGSARRLPAADRVHQGAGLLDVAAAAAAPTPSKKRQPHAYSTGLGSLDAARGSVRVHDGTTALSGEQDIFGTPWDGASWSGASWSGASWSGGVWNGSTWSGASWSGASWSGASWSGASWSGASWSGASWSGASWSGASWSGASWSGASWSGASWSGASWSGASWS